MKTKFIAIFILLSLLMIPAAARAEFRYGPMAGVNFNSLKMSQALVPVHGAVGAQGGVQAEMMFPGIGFGIDFGLLYNMQGAKLDLGSREVWASSGIGNHNVMMHTIQIPFHLRFKWTRMNGLEDYIAPFVSGGPDFSILAGHSGFKGNDGIHPLKYAAGGLGLSVGGGAELLRRWQVSVQYTWGMSYLLKTRKLDDFTGRPRQWSVRVAYLF